MDLATSATTASSVSKPRCTMPSSGRGCVIGLGAVVIGVSLPPGRYVGRNVVVDDQEQANALPSVGDGWRGDFVMKKEVESNHELAATSRQALSVPGNPGRGRAARRLVPGFGMQLM